MPTQMEVSCARSRLTYAAGTEDWITFSLYIFLCLLYPVTSICCIAPFTTTSHTCFNFALLSIFNIQWLLLFIFINQPTPYSPKPRFQFLSFFRTLFVSLQSAPLTNIVFFLNSSRARAVASCGNPVTRSALVLKTEHDPSELRLVLPHFPCFSLPKLKRQHRLR